MILTPLFLTTSLIAAVLLSLGFLVIRKLNNVVLTQRLYTWVAISVVFTSAYLLGDFYFRVLVLLIGLVMLYELTKLMNLLASGAALVLLVTWVQFWDIAFFETPARLSFALLVSAFLVFVFSEKSKPSSLLIGFYGVLLITVAWPMAVMYPDKTLALLLTVGCFDVAGYVGGKNFATGFLNYKIYPKTSPNKTLAGLVAGTLAAALVLVALGHFSWLGLGSICVGAVAGDWLESKAKRLAGVKDAGNWLPGFGGLLDRFDSILLLAPLAVFIF